VFCKQISSRLSAADLANFLRPCGRIREARIVEDKISKRSKGIAYVEFYEQSSVSRAIQCTGQLLMGIPIVIQPTESERNRHDDHYRYFYANIVFQRKLFLTSYS
jgi:RNA-binding protein 39